MLDMSDEQSKENTTFLSLLFANYLYRIIQCLSNWPIKLMLQKDKKQIKMDYLFLKLWVT